MDPKGARGLAVPPTPIHQPRPIVWKFSLNYCSLANEAGSQYAPPDRRPSEEINISQTPVKSPEATESIFHRQEVIKSPDPAPPVFEAAGSPVSEQRGWPDAI